MASINFYFQVHQPHRLKPYSVFHTDPFYFDEDANGEICNKVADKCYRPTTKLMLDLVRKHEGNFRLSYAITGTVIDQWKKFCPDVLDLFVQLAETGCCEFVAETYYHSLSYIYSQEEFAHQVDMHTKLIEEHFGQTPTVFRNTELIYTNELSKALSKIKDKDGNPRFLGTICEGTDRHLGYRSPNYVYRPPNGDNDQPLMGPDGRPFGLLLKNYKLSDDIAFRFSNKGWEEWPLTTEKFAKWVHDINGDGYLCNLFMDYETFGEHQWEDTGIFNFMQKLPEFISWADTERDLSAWRGNDMQHNALEETYKVEEHIKERLIEVKAAGDTKREIEMEHIINDWRKLTTSDHFYYMCTKYWADGDVHKYFSPYDSPYDGYINFMNVLDNVRTRIAKA